MAKLTFWALSGLMVACSTSPPMRPDGLPIVPRYTNSIQFDWMLGSYGQAAARAMGTGQVDGLLEEACLGWERALFDIESARLYPLRLRMSTDSANLSLLTEEAPAIIRRHPRPAACESLTPRVSTDGASPAVKERLLLARLRVALGLSREPASPEPAAASALPPAAETTVAPVAAPVVQADTPLTGESAAAASSPPAAASPAPAAAAPEVAAVESAAGPVGIDIAALAELADSDVQTVRLRARYHLLGQCVLAVEASDHAWLGAGGSRSDVAGHCHGAKDGEARRVAQRRLVKSLLVAWRGRHVEPMSDLVVALASFATRDNPVLQSTSSLSR